MYCSMVIGSQKGIFFHFGAKKMIRDWRTQVEKLKKLEKSKNCLCKLIANRTDLQAEVKKWITDCRNSLVSLSTKRDQF